MRNMSCSQRGHTYCHIVSLLFASGPTLSSILEMGPKKMAPKKKAAQRRGQKATRKTPSKTSQPQQRLKNVANQNVSKVVGTSGVKTRAMLRREQEEAAKNNEQSSGVSDKADTQPDGEQDADVSDNVVKQADNEQSEARSGSSVASTTTSEAIAAIDGLERRLEVTEASLSAAKDDWLKLKKYLGQRMFPKDPGMTPGEYDDERLAGMIERKLPEFVKDGSRKWQVSGAYWDLENAVRKGELRRAKLQVQLRRKFMRARAADIDAHRIPASSTADADADTDTDTDDEDDEDALSNSSITVRVLERLRDGTLDQFMNSEISDKGSEVSVDDDEVIADNDTEKARDRYLAARREVEDAQTRLEQSWHPLAYPLFKKVYEEAQKERGELLLDLDNWILDERRRRTRRVDLARPEYSEAASEAHRYNAVNSDDLSSRFGTASGTTTSEPHGFGGPGMPDTHKQKVPDWLAETHDSGGDVESVVWSEPASEEATTASLITVHSLVSLKGELAHWRYRRHIQKWTQLRETLWDEMLADWDQQCLGIAKPLTPRPDRIYVGKKRRKEIREARMARTDGKGRVQKSESRRRGVFSCCSLM